MEATKPSKPLDQGGTEIQPALITTDPLYTPITHTVEGVKESWMTIDPVYGPTTDLSPHVERLTEVLFSQRIAGKIEGILSVKGYILNKSTDSVEYFENVLSDIDKQIEVLTAELKERQAKGWY